MRYTPQDWFELGLMISATTFIGCIAYLFYDRRREKGDRWTGICKVSKNILHFPKEEFATVSTGFIL